MIKDRETTSTQNIPHRMTCTFVRSSYKETNLQFKQTCTIFMVLPFKLLDIPTKRVKYWNIRPVKLCQLPNIKYKSILPLVVEVNLFFKVRNNSCMFLF